jgi:hypothetical protein
MKRIIMLACLVPVAAFAGSPKPPPAPAKAPSEPTVAVPVSTALRITFFLDGVCPPGSTRPVCGAYQDLLRALNPPTPAPAK